jgi:chemosensory pili system protein ChpA (sensor histidine kinase/response regulator)
MSEEIRVLVGDDDVMDRVYTGWGFKKWCPQIRVDFARTGEDVIRYLEDKSHPKPALVILDSMEPRVDGFAVVAWIRTQKDLEETPIVMWSGRVDEKNVARARGLGVKDYVGKPNDPTELKQLIRNWKRSYLTPSNAEANSDSDEAAAQESDTQQFFKLQ